MVMKCPYCDDFTYEDVGRMTVTLDDRLMVIEDVPARICRGCLEQFFGEEILAKVELLRGDKFASSTPIRVIEVPVFAWEEL